MKAKKMKAPRLSSLHIVLFIIFQLIIVGAGYKYFKTAEQNFKSSIENQLRLIADLKVEEVGHWIKERRSDAQTVFGNEVFARYIKRYFKNANDGAAKNEIKVWMEEFRTGFDYDAVFLTDSTQKRRISLADEPELPTSNISKVNLDTLKSGKLVFSDFYMGKFKHKIFLKILIPFLDSGRLIGIIELRIDPQSYLYPILSKWPVSSETSEAFILRPVGNTALYLSELRFQKKSAMNLRVPIENRDLIAVRAVLGQNGLVEGLGYRGTRVFGFVKRIPDSPWYLVTQMDESEFVLLLLDKRRETLLFVIVLFLISLLGFVLMWRNQKTLFYQEKVASAEALRESEQRFRILFDKAPLSYQSLDVNGNILDVNQTWCDTFGYTREALIGKWFGNFLATNEIEAFRERFRVFKSSGKLHSEFEMIHKDGTSRFISFEGRVARDSDGNFIQTHGILQDITLLKKVETEQRIIYEIAQGVTITSNLNDLLKMIHLTLGKVLYSENIFVALYDPATERFNFPYFVDQFDSIPEPVKMGKSCTAYVFETGIPLLLNPELFEQLNREGKVELVGSPSPSWVGIPLQTTHQTIGVLVLQHYEKENIYSEHEVQFLYSIGSHIANAIERRKADENLRNERLLLRTVIDNIPDSIYCKDTAARKTLANLTDLRHSGVKSEAAIIGKTDFDFYPEELAARFFADDQTVLQTGEAVLNREENIVEENSGNRWLLSSKLPLRDSNGQIVGLVGIGHDITALKRNEAEIILKNEQLIKVNAEKDKFFSIIAHDLRSPFNGFLGLTQIMADELSDLTMDELQKIAVSMQNSAINLYRLLENLLEWSKVQQGLITNEPGVLKLLPLVNECVSTVYESAKGKGIEIELCVNDGIEVFADVNMLQTVIRNLVSNSVKFTPKGGKVTISALNTKANFVEVSITDTGIGMSCEMVENLFRIDVQTNRKGTEGEPSTGLGLLLCKEFIEKQGGTIWVESEVGQGSTFYFTLPVIPNHN